MRSKTILSIAAFVVAFAGSAAFASLFVANTAYTSTYALTSRSNYKCRTVAAREITALIQQDIRHGRDNSHTIYRIESDYRPSFESATFPEYAKAVEIYISRSETIADENLPSGFQTEWRNHLKAWRDYSDFLNKMKNTSYRKNLDETDREDLERFHSGEISRTWFAVLQTGASYGADVPRK